MPTSPSPETAAIVLDGLLQERASRPGKPPLVELRRAAGISQDELAAILGITRGAVQLWERNVRNPSPEHCAALVAVFERMGQIVGGLTPAQRSAIDQLAAKAAQMKTAPAVEMPEAVNGSGGSHDASRSDS